MADISVVIPARNRASQLQKTLNSVLSQTYKAKEIIVVDDCSTDDTRAVAEAFGPSVRLIRHEKPLGAQAARNSGIRAACGDIIAFNDSDDYWVNEKLAIQSAYMASHQYGVIHCGCFRFHEETHTYSCFGMDLHEFQGNVHELLLRRSGPMFQGLMGIKKFFEKIDFLDERIPAYQEWETFIRLSTVSSIGYIPLPLFIYTVGKNDAISASISRAAEGYKMIVEKHKKEIVKVHGIKVLANHYNRLVQLYTQAGQEENASYFQNLRTALQQPD